MTLFVLVLVNRYTSFCFHCRTTPVHVVNLASLRNCLTREGMEDYCVSCWFDVLKQTHVSSSFSTLCVCSVLKMGPHPRPPPVIRTAQLLRSVWLVLSVVPGKTFCTPQHYDLTLSLPFLLELGSPTFIHIPLWVRSVRPRDFWRKLRPSNAATCRGQQGDRKQERKGNGITAAIQCAATTGSTCSSTTGYAPRRSAHIRGVRHFQQ